MLALGLMAMFLRNQQKVFEDGFKAAVELYKQQQNDDIFTNYSNSHRT